MTAELSRKQASDKQVRDCAEQARRAGEDYSRYSSGLGPSHISGISNHYNHKLNKCIVDVQTADANGRTEFVMDAYEQQSSILWCITTFVPTSASPMQRTCMDSKNNRVDPTEADTQIDALMRD